MFGGYTSLSWDMSDNYYVDNSIPFIFSLSKKTKHLNFIKEKSIYKASSCLVIFGAGARHDIRINDNCDSNANSLSNLGYCYDPP